MFRVSTVFLIFTTIFCLCSNDILFGQTLSKIINKSQKNEALEILLFYSPGCGGCPEIEDKLLPKIKTKYGKRICIKKYDITEIRNYKLLIEYEERYRVKKNVPIQLFVGGFRLSGKGEIIKNLEPVINKLLTGKPKTLMSDLDHKSSTLAATPKITFLNSKIVERFSSFSILPVLSAGLLDGVNPCAFATIVFFISLLSFVGKERKEIIQVGIFFSIAVFLTYLLLGIGVFNILKKLNTFTLFSKIFYYIIVIIVFMLGFYNIYDCLIYRRTGQSSQMRLQLPNWAKKKSSSDITLKA